MVNSPGDCGTVGVREGEVPERASLDSPWVPSALRKGGTMATERLSMRRAREILR